MIEVRFTNDVHSHVPRAVAVLDELVAARRAGALVVDSGDFIGGSAFHRFSAGAVERRLAGDCFDALMVGNHDLEDGDADYLPTLLCANLLRRGEPAFVPHRRFVRAGRSVAITGILGLDAFAATPRRARRDLSLVPPTDVLDRLLPALAAESDFVILLSHSGFANDQVLARRYPMLTAILSGHCHSDEYVARSGSVMVAKAPEHGEGMGILRLVPDGRSHAEVVRLPARQRFDESLLQRHSSTLVDFERWSQRPLHDLSQRFIAAAPSRAQQLKRLATALLQRAGSSLCLLNLHALRAEFVAGPLSFGGLHDRLPFADQVRIIPLRALPHDWRARLAASHETIVRAGSEEGDDASVATTDFVAMNVLGVDDTSRWRAIGPLHAFVSQCPQALFDEAP
jgi:5'-nucleotidase/UDP-sugar diphosphatase